MMAKAVGLVFIGLLCVVPNVLVLQHWNASYILNDGAQYLSTASNWLAGRGFSTDALIFTPHFQGTLPAPQTVWPPGYPLLVGLFSLLGLSLEKASLWLNLVFLAISALLLFMILRRNKLTITAALVCTLFFYLTAIPWSYSMGLVTESVFSTCILAAILFLPTAKTDKLWLWIISGLFIALCVAIRYSGVFFAVGVGLGMFAFIVKNHLNDAKQLFRNFAKLSVQLSMSVVLFFAMMYRTYTLTGTIDRDVAYAAPESFNALFQSIAWQARLFLGFTDDGLLPVAVAKVLFVVLVLIILVVLALSLFVLMRSNTAPSESTRSQGEAMLFVIAGHSAVFAGFFGLSAVGVTIVELTHRYLYQIYPGLFIVFCILVAKAISKFDTIEKRAVLNWFRYALFSLIGVFSVAQINFATGLSSFISPGRDAQEVLGLPVSGTVDLNSMVQSCFEGSEAASSAIWSNDGQLLHWNTKIPTITFADKYSVAPYDIEGLAKLIDLYGIKMFVILNNMEDVPVRSVQTLGLIKQWLQDNDHTKLTMLENEISNGIVVDVYIVDKQCLGVL